MRNKFIATIFAFILLTFSLLLPASIFASGPSITIGEKTCPAVSGLQYTYYVASDDECVVVTLVPYSRTTVPAVSATGTGELPGLLAFNFPTFLSFEQIEDFSVWSYLSMLVSIIFSLIIIFWVLTLVRAGLAVMTSNGDPSGMQSAQKKFSSIFAGLIFLVGFFLLINIVASFLGIGNFTEWPKVFSQCRDGEYYFNKKLSGYYNTETDVDNACFVGCASFTC